MPAPRYVPLVEEIRDPIIESVHYGAVVISNARGEIVLFQVTILETFSDLSGIPLPEIALGTDGCSAPVFAVPLHSAACSFARLADPQSLPDGRKTALRRIFSAMTTHPDRWPGAFDTILMQVGRGQILSKAGAEGYLALALLPGAYRQHSPALGIAIKISDGDRAIRARTTVTIAVLASLVRSIMTRLHSIRISPPDRCLLGGILRLAKFMLPFQPFPYTFG